MSAVFIGIIVMVGVVFAVLFFGRHEPTVPARVIRAIYAGVAGIISGSLAALIAAFLSWVF